MGEEREKVQTDSDDAVRGDEVEAHKVQTDDAEMIRSDDEVEGHALVSDNIRAEQVREQARGD